MKKVPFLDYGEVLVTGGTGFLGRYVCRVMISRGILPRLLVRTGSEERIPDDIRRSCRVTPGDVSNRESVRNAAQSTEAIVHLAGIIREDPASGSTFEKVHVEGTRNAVLAAGEWGIRRFVHVSVLGAEPRDLSDYFDTKGRAEEIVRRSDRSWTIFRPGLIFGPGDRFVSELRRSIVRAPVFPVPGTGEFPLQPVFAGDVAKGIVDCLSRPGTEGAAYDVAGPERFAYGELVDRVAAAAGTRVRKVGIPLPAMRRMVRFLSRFRRFPLSPEMLAVLVAGHTCDPVPYYSVFNLNPLPLSSYLASMGGTDLSAAGDGDDARRSTAAGKGAGKGETSSRKAA